MFKEGFGFVFELLGEPIGLFQDQALGTHAGHRRASSLDVTRKNGVVGLRVWTNISMGHPKARTDARYGTCTAVVTTTMSQSEVMVASPRTILPARKATSQSGQYSARKAEAASMASNVRSFVLISLHQMRKVAQSF